MKTAIDSFHVNMARVRDIGALHDALRAQTTQTLDLSDILRAELVLAVSALDHYIHEVVRAGMLEIYRGLRPETPSFLQFSVSLGSLLGRVDGTERNDWLDAEIRRRHKWLTFQQPDKIADAIRLISDVTLWEEVGRRLGMGYADVKNELSLIIDRRNKIAHEADVDPTLPGARWPITGQQVNDALGFIEGVVNSLDAILRPAGIRN